MPDYLTILPSFFARRDADGKGIILTKKFVSGVTEYCKRWKGPVQVVIEEGAGGDDLDQVAVRSDELPFELHLASYEPASFRPFAEQSAVVLLGAHYRQTPLVELCAHMGVPAVYTTEYTLRTRLQIGSMEKVNPIVRARRILWQWQEERRQRRAIGLAAGIQCNGTPTYDVYHAISRDPLLYFDSRVTGAMLASQDAVEARVETMKKSGVMRLAFSGRLIPMKGADHLVRVAMELRRLGARFHLTICGGGSLEAEMRQQVTAHNLGELVLFRNTLDFATELMPLIRARVDLFVCCHRQGDPSCTYLETMACGVPIAGYANEAFRGLVEKSGTGWTVPLNRPELLAQQISHLCNEVEELKRHSLRALAFAREHTFEQTFAARVKHLQKLASRRSPKNMR